MKVKRSHFKQSVKASAYAGKRSIMAAAGAGMQIIVNSKAYVDVYEDDYEQGEGAHVNTWEADVRGTYRSIQDLVNAISQYGFSDNVSDYGYIDGRIFTDAMVDVDNDEPSAAQIEAWKRGEEQLYAARFDVTVNVGDVHPMTEEEAESLGIGIY